MRDRGGWISSQETRFQTDVLNEHEDSSVGFTKIKVLAELLKLVLLSTLDKNEIVKSVFM